MGALCGQVFFISFAPVDLFWFIYLGQNNTWVKVNPKPSAAHLVRFVKIFPFLHSHSPTLGYLFYSLIVSNLTFLLFFLLQFDVAANGDTFVILGNLREAGTQFLVATGSDITEWQEVEVKNPGYAYIHNF
jgi:hypothetical protein